MKNTREWIHGGLPNLHYYVDLTGRIVGETSITGTGNTSKYSTAVYPNPTDTKTLGVYISPEKAKQAIERYYEKEDSVYDMINDRMLSQ
jgi:hypothetical protein